VMGSAQMIHYLIDKLYFDTLVQRATCIAFRWRHSHRWEFDLTHIDIRWALL